MIAHLLTANVNQAEEAVLIAIDSFDPDTDTDESLFQSAISAAVRLPWRTPNLSRVFLPAELQSVLNLPGELRRCFVLRVLLGMSRQACAALLRLNVRSVERHTCNALQHFGCREQFEFNLP